MVDDVAESAQEFIRLFSRHDPELRAFVRSCLPRSSDVDEVMQEVSLAAWRKFSTLTDHSAFPRWACLIARYEILAFRRRHARDRLIFDEDLVACLAEEAKEEIELRKEQLDMLDDCVSKLPDNRRQLLLAAYAPNQSIKALAAQLDRTEGSLHQLLSRLRDKLLACVTRALKADGRLV